MPLFNWLEVALYSGAAFNKVRTYVIVAVFFLMGVQYFRQRRAHKAQRREETPDEHLTDHYQKDEDGHYPWETDVDDSPSRIPPDSKRIQNTWGKKRGKW